MANLNPLGLAWLGYALASLLLIFLSWRMSRNWRPAALGRLFRVWLAVLLITPAYVEEGVNALAPAWVVTLFITAGEGLQAARPGYLPLVSALGLATALVIGGAIVQGVRGGNGAREDARRELRSMAAGRGRG